jgi:hypothetical protein
MKLLLRFTFWLCSIICGRHTFQIISPDYDIMQSKRYRGWANKPRAAEVMDSG